MRGLVLGLLLALHTSYLIPHTFGSSLAPIYFKYTPDTCFIDEQTNCIAVDMTYVSVMQRAGVNVIVEYGDDLNGWQVVEYSSAPPMDQLIYFAWFTQVAYRAPLRFFRARESTEPTDFLAPLPPLPGLVKRYSGVVPLF